MKKKSGMTSNTIKMGLLSCNRICPSLCICFPLRVLGNTLWNRPTGLLPEDLDKEMLSLSGLSSDFQGLPELKVTIEQ